MKSSIGKNDWGGVQFYIPQGWNISKALSSYLNDNSGEANNHAAIWNTADPESEWKSYVEIGRAHNQKPTGGGAGTVVIELTNAESTSTSDAFSLLVAVQGKTIIRLPTPNPVLSLSMRYCLNIDA